MFRFREVEKHFDAEDRMPKKAVEEYKQIKPETDIKVEEAASFVNSLFGF